MKQVYTTVDNHKNYYIFFKTVKFQNINIAPFSFCPQVTACTEKDNLDWHGKQTYHMEAAVTLLFNIILFY